MVENWSWTTRKAEKIYMGEPFKENIARCFKKLLNTNNRNQAQKTLHKLYKCAVLHKNHKQLHTLIENTVSCFSQCPPRFVGFEVKPDKITQLSE
jgi:hypothetical protein